MFVVKKDLKWISVQLIQKRQKTHVQYTYINRRENTNNN